MHVIPAQWEADAERAQVQAHPGVTYKHVSKSKIIKGLRILSQYEGSGSNLQHY